MGLILEKNAVLEVYQQAAENKWVVPTFCTENLTTTEAILSATLDYSKIVGIPDIPITIAITNLYPQRSQSINYTNTGRWDIGIQLFLKDLDILTRKGSPFEQIKVMVHLDHILWDKDEALLKWDMKQFSSIMYDASELPLEKNMELTACFVEKFHDRIAIEGACDEIYCSGNREECRSELTTPQAAEKYLRNTGVDFIVANLGTEHRASKADIKYQGELARSISKLTGPKLVLHGASSVKKEELKYLFNDGISKVNIWTTLERDSTPKLFEEMLKNASRLIGGPNALELINKEFLGKGVEKDCTPALSHYTTKYRQDIVFQEMKKIVMDYLNLWYCIN